MSVPKKVDDFIDDLTGRSPDTIQNYESFANIFFGYVKKKPEDVTVKDIMDFLKWGEREREWQLSTVRHYAQLAQRFLTEFRSQDFIDDLKKKIRNLPRVQKYRSLYEGIYIPPDRIDDFIKAAPNPELKIVYTMILKWGLRLGEALHQRVEDIYAKLLKVIVRGKGAGREHKIRNVWVDSHSLQKVLEYAGCSMGEIQGSRPIRKRGKIVNLSPRTVQLAWKRTARKIRLRNWKKLTPHDGRHSYALDFLLKRKKEGMRALILLKNQLGHSDVNTTMIYLDIAGSEAREIFDAGIKQE